MTKQLIDEEAYNELIGKVMKIDGNAALYMATEAKELDSFTYHSNLLDVFQWCDTPQGASYWAGIHDVLLETYNK